MSLEDFLTPQSIPVEEAASFFLRVKRAYEEPDTTGAFEGSFTVPLPQALALMADMVKNEMKTMYAYMTYANSLRDFSHHSIAEEFEDHADNEQEHANFLLRRMAALGGPIELPDIPAPPAATDPTAIIKIMLRMEQEGVARWKALHAILGDNPMRFKVEEYMTREQEHLDELWQLLPHTPEAKMASIREKVKGVIGQVVGAAQDGLPVNVQHSGVQIVPGSIRHVVEGLPNIPNIPEKFVHQVEGLPTVPSSLRHNVKVEGLPTIPSSVRHKIEGLPNLPTELTHKVEGVPNIPTELTHKIEGVPNIPTELTHKITGMPNIPDKVVAEHVLKADNASLAKALGGSAVVGGGLVGLNAGLNSKEAADSQPSNPLQSLGKYLGDHPRLTSAIAGSVTGVTLAPKNPKDMLLGAAAGAAAGAAFHDIRQGMRMGKHPDVDSPAKGYRDWIRAGATKTSSDDDEVKKRVRAALASKFHKERATRTERAGDVVGRVLGVAGGVAATHGRAPAERAAAAFIAQQIGGKAMKELGREVDAHRFSKAAAWVKRALEEGEESPQQYLAREAQASAASMSSEQDYFRQRYQEAKQQAESAAQQQQALSEQLQQAQQESATAQQQIQSAQEQAQAAVQQARAAMTSAMQKSLASQSELIQQQSVSAQTRDALMDMKKNLQDILSSPTPPATTEEAAGVAQPPATAAPGATGPESAGQGAPVGGPMDQAAPQGEVGPVEEDPSQPKVGAFNPNVAAGAAGALIGLGGAVYGMKKDTSDIESEVNELSRVKNPTFYDEYKLTAAKAKLDGFRYIKKHPVPSAVAMTLGGAMGGLQSPPMMELMSRIQTPAHKLVK